MKTPQTKTIVLLAGQDVTLPFSGQHMHVRSCTVASFEAGFDDDPPQTIYPGGTYPSTSPFSRIRFRDSLGGGCTIVIIIGDAEFQGIYDAAILATISATLTGQATNIADIETLLEKNDAATPFVQNPVAQTGVGENQIITAAAVNRRVQVQAPIANAGLVYVSFVTGVTAANAHTGLNPGDTFEEVWAGNVFVCSQNGTEIARGYVASIA